MRESTLIQYKSRLSSMSGTPGICQPLEPEVWNARKRYIIQTSKKLLKEADFGEAKQILENIRDWTFAFAPSTNRLALPGQVMFAAGRVSMLLSRHLGI